MFKNALLVFCLSLALLFSTNSFAADALPKSQLDPTSSISKVPTKNFYSIEGYVVHVYECPECPKPGLCAPCKKDHILFSRTKEEYNPDKIASYVTIYTNELQDFEAGKKYLILVQVVSGETGGKYRMATDFHEIPEE